MTLTFKKSVLIILLLIPGLLFGQQHAKEKEPDRAISPPALSYFYVNQNIKSMSNIQEEIWKDVVGYEGIYQVSSIGRLKGINRCGTLGGILKGQQHYKGYREQVLALKGHEKKFKVHRIVAIAFIPNPNNLPQVNHKNGIKTDNRVENLEWCSNLDNQRHSWEKLGRTNGRRAAV